MQHTSVKIANGASESGPVELWNNTLTAIHLGDWTAADITLLAATGEKGPFVPMHDAAGDELVITAAPNRMIALDPTATRGARYLKLRSGTTATPVNQGADRTLRLMLRDDT